MSHGPQDLLEPVVALPVHFGELDHSEVSPLPYASIKKPQRTVGVVKVGPLFRVARRHGWQLVRVAKHDDLHAAEGVVLLAARLPE